MYSLTVTTESEAMNQECSARQCCDETSTTRVVTASSASVHPREEDDIIVDTRGLINLSGAHVLGKVVVTVGNRIERLDVAILLDYYWF